MIMLSNMTMMECVIIKWDDGKLHGNISRNGYGNVIIGRYGGSFEEGNGGCMVPAKVSRY